MDEHKWQGTLDERARMEVRARVILAVKPGASSRELKQAFRRAARRHHPDRNPDDSGAQERFLDAVAAYELLEGGRPSRRLLTCALSPSLDIPGPGGYLEGSWGYFAWWRDSFPVSGGQEGVSHGG